MHLVLKVSDGVAIDPIDFGKSEKGEAIVGLSLLNGDAQANHLEGGDGNDLLAGGSGADQFVFNTAPNAASNVDTINDFEVGNDDLIVLDHAVFVALTPGALAPGQFVSGPNPVASDGDDHVLYNTAPARSSTTQTAPAALRKCRSPP